MVSSFCANCKREIDTCPQMEYNVANFKVKFRFIGQLDRTLGPLPEGAVTEGDWGSVLISMRHSLRPRFRSATSLKEGGKAAASQMPDKLRFTFLRPYKKDVHSHVLLSSFRPDIQVIVHHTGSGVLNIDAVDQVDDAPIRQDIKEHGFGANRDHQCAKGHLV